MEFSPLLSSYQWQYLCHYSNSISSRQIPIEERLKTEIEKEYSKEYFLNRFSLEMSVWNSYPSPADSLWVLFTRFPFPFVQLNRNWQLIFPGRELWEHCLQFILPGRDWQKKLFLILRKGHYHFQWVPLYLTFLAFFFYTPRYVWLKMEGGLMKLFR